MKYFLSLAALVLFFFLIVTQAFAQAADGCNRIFNLSDEEITKAIELGKSGETNLKRNRFYNRYKLPVESYRLGIKLPEARITTPYFLIVKNASLKSADFEKYSIEEAREVFSQLKSDNVLIFELTAYSDNIAMGETLRVVLKQGDKVIQPVEIVGKDELAKITSLWRFPTYMLQLQVKFDAGEIDFSKGAELVYLYPGERKLAGYWVNFKRYQ